MASSLSLELYRALEAGGRVEVVAVADGSGYRVAAEAGTVTFLACPREPGRAYRPAQFAAREEADALAGRLAAVLCPPPGAAHELYFNTRNFSRPPEVRG
jgi:hypothetical protein